MGMGVGGVYCVHRPGLMACVGLGDLLSMCVSRGWGYVLTGGDVDDLYSHGKY